MPRPLNPVQSDPGLPEAADAVVIGAGMAGVSAAYFLAKKGHSVALIEKGVVAGEQSSRNWGWCRVQNRDEREIPLMQHSMELWASLPQEIGADLGFRRKGIVYVTKDPAELASWQAWVDMARKYQAHSRMVGPEEARALTPGNDQAWIGGVVSPNDGRAEPAVAAPALAEAARRLGVSLHQNCAVRGLDTTGGRVSGVFTEKGRIRTSAVLCAAGAWASMFCRRHGIDLPQSAVHSTVFATTPAPQVSPGGLSTPDFILTPLPDGGYIVAAKTRGRVEITPQGIRYARKFLPTLMKRRKNLQIRVGRSFFQGPEAIVGKWSFDKPTPFERMRVLDPEPNTAIVDDALRTVVAAYPALEGIGMARIWAGWIDSTPDAVPVISPVPAIPGFFLTTGYSGHGFGIGPGAGRLAADIVAGDRPIVDPEPFSYTRLVDGRAIREPGMM
jgi:glycine/D-amino acid oxidase-like deaminating enzyme